MRRVSRKQHGPGGVPRLLPEESTQRASRIAVDMCVMNTQYFITLSDFLSDGELFQVQMQLLYGLIDTMGATNNVDAKTILDIADKYFKQLRKERHETDKQPTDF